MLILLSSLSFNIYVAVWKLTKLAVSPDLVSKFVTCVLAFAGTEGKRICRSNLGRWDRCM